MIHAHKEKQKTTDRVISDVLKTWNKQLIEESNVINFRSMNIVGTADRISGPKTPCVF